jgi:hypothetical protein
MEQIQSQEQWVLHRLEKFYANKENLEKVRKVLSGESVLSLRLIDWFVTNYAKMFNRSFVNDNGKYVIVYLSYKSHLKAYSKKMFDPFCRCKRIKFSGMDTTVGQLNFFQWIISDGILDYMYANRDEIHQDMECRINTSKNSDKKRQEISHCASDSISTHDICVKVSFK